MKKLIALLFPLLVLTGCNGNGENNSTSSTTVSSNTPISSTTNISSSSSSSHQGTPKTLYGIAPIFDDPLGIYDKDPSIIVEGDKQYVFYTTNEIENVTNDVIAMRVGTKQGDKYVYSDAKVCLRPSENGWDSVRVSNPDIVKGEFKYQGTTYSYLLAYQGNSKVKDKIYEIGFAVSNDLENWTKVGDKAVITYSSYALGSAYGCGAPSLVSYDQKGKVYCFYTYADALITSTRVNYLDCSDLDNIVMGEPSAVSTHGLQDKNADVIFNNADFMIDKGSNTLYVVRDRNPVMTMPATSDSVQVAKASLDILTNPFDNEWELVMQAIDNIETSVLDGGSETQEYGWERIFSPCFITNAYSVVENATTLDVAFSVSAEGSASDSSYIYSPAIVAFSVEL